MDDRFRVAGVVGWLRPLAVLVVVVVMVVGYRFLPWAPNLPASDGVVGVAISGSDQSFSESFVYEAFVIVFPARGSSGLERIEDVARWSAPYDGVAFGRFHSHGFEFRLTRDRFDGLGGRVARLEDSTFELRSVQSGRYLVCFGEVSDRLVSVSRCGVGELVVPGVVELDLGQVGMGVEARRSW